MDAKEILNKAFKFQSCMPIQPGQETNIFKAMQEYAEQYHKQELERVMPSEEIAKIKEEFRVFERPSADSSVWMLNQITGENNTFESLTKPDKQSLSDQPEEKKEEWNEGKICSNCELFLGNGKCKISTGLIDDPELLSCDKFTEKSLTQPDKKEKS